jgi:hypothetical protein
LAVFFAVFFFVTRVAAAFVVPVVLFEDAAFGEIFFSAIWFTSYEVRAPTSSLDPTNPTRASSSAGPR